MKDLRKRIFRKADEVKSDSGKAGKGIILPKNEMDERRTEILAGGGQPEPLYLYMGDTDLLPGETVTAYGGRYLVLNSEQVSAFGKLFCSRAVLERAGEADA